MLSAGVVLTREREAISFPVWLFITLYRLCFVVQRANPPDMYHAERVCYEQSKEASETEPGCSDTLSGPEVNVFYSLSLSHTQTVKTETPLPRVFLCCVHIPHWAADAPNASDQMFSKRASVDAASVGLSLHKCTSVSVLLFFIHTSSLAALVSPISSSMGRLLPMVGYLMFNALRFPHRQLQACEARRWESLITKTTKGRSHTNRHIVVKRKKMGVDPATSGFNAINKSCISTGDWLQFIS